MTKRALFSIQRLKDMKKQTIDISGEETICIYLVLSGELMISDKQYPVSLEDNMLFWVCYEKSPRLDTVPNTDGYVIRFSKVLLQSSKEEFYSSFVSALCPCSNKGELIQVGDLFLKEGVALCEMMLQEYKCTSDYKMELLRVLLSVFLLHLIRRSDILMYLPEASERRSYALVS